MLIGIDKNGNRYKPTKDVECFCPECNSKLVAKMGNIKIHHWSHKNISDCKYGEGETMWHLEWKNNFIKD